MSTRMKLIIFLIFFIPIISQACIVSPTWRSAKNAEQLKSKSDAVFFGKLESFTLKDEIQIATFTVIKSFKGNLKTKVIVQNPIKSSCAAGFTRIGEAYYVFANKKWWQTQYRIPESGATFVSLAEAIEFNMELSNDS